MTKYIITTESGARLPIKLPDFGIGVESAQLNTYFGHCNCHEQLPVKCL